MTDIWVCGSCHSINRQRGKRCYKCGAAQEAAATGEMANLRQEQAIISRTVVAYRPALALALAATLFLLVFAFVSVGRLLFAIDFYQFFDDQLGKLAATGTMDEKAILSKALAGAPWIFGGLVVIPTLLFFAAWLSRVVSNVPALGGGVPNTSPGRAFVNTLIPVVNLWTVPGMIQDVMYRLDPKGGGLFMVGLAWLGLVGSFFISFIAGWYLNLRTTFDTASADTAAEFVKAARPLYTASVILDVITSVLVIVGAIVLILVMMRIERRSRARDREVRDLAGV
jgi:hypothetical protein